MGLLTKIFGNPESGANGSGEPSVADEQASDTAASPSSSKAQATSRAQASSRGAGSSSEAASGSKGAGTSGPGGSGGAASGGGAGSNGAATGEKNAHSPFAKGEGGRSGIRPTVDPTRPREAARPTTPSRRPEHPRMYLRPTPATLDPAVPGTTRRQPISVRPGAKEGSLSRGSAPPSSSASRGSAPPPKRRRPELGGGDPPSWRELPPEPPSTRPPSSHPRPAMVVSPVSLTAEELQPGARPKMPTLVGLGTAIGVPALPDYEGTEADYEDTEADYEDASDSLLDDATALGAPEARSAEAESSRDESAARGDAAPSEPAAAPFELSAPVSRPGEGARAEEAAGGSPAAEASASGEVQDAVTPERIVASAQLLADFALKLSLGPVSRAWVPEVRRSADTLLLAGQQRQRTTLSAVAARLLELLPSADAAATAPAEAASVEAASVEAAPVEAAPVEAASVEAASVEAAPETPDVASATAVVEPIVTEPAVAEPAAAIAAQPAELGPLGGVLRERVLHEVSRLTGLLPEWPAAAQDLAEETRRRETRIVRELLSSVDGLRRDQRARIEAQLGLEALGSMVPEALAEELEAPPERAAELGLVIEIYRLQRQEQAPDVGNVAAVAQALSELERRQSEFENCDPERKDVQQVLRGRRREAAMQLNLSLAERGELEWLELLEPMSVPERIERLHHWLDASNEKPQSERPSSERLSRA